YAEALYAEDIARRNGEDSGAAYLAYIATVRDRIENVIPVAPRESRSTKDMYTLPDGGFNGDIYFKGSWFLHTLRYLMDDDEAFFRALRRIMYPDPALEAATDGSANHFITTVDVQAAFEAESRMDLSVYFEVYLRQPVLPRLVVVPVLDDRATLRWELPDGILAEEQTFDLPVEVDWGTGPQRIEMTGGQASIQLTARIDPNGRILFARDSAASE
ncbi:MAG: M1 family peptidase, partial [Bacteroidetes bacterium]|nr:M1 family peptidase [Bacteroidota bacterium]